MADGMQQLVVIGLAIFVVPNIMAIMPDFDPLLLVVCVMLFLAGMQHLSLSHDGVGVAGGEDRDNGRRPRRSNGATDERAAEATSADVLDEVDKCLDQNSWAKAQQLAKEVLDKEPENARAWEALARAQKWSGNAAQAAATVKKAWDIYEVTSPCLRQLAQDLDSSSAQPEEAAKECEKKGEAFLEKRQYDLASECYAKALEALEAAAEAESISDLRFRLLRRRAECAQQLHDWSTCKRAATAVLNAEPNDTKALLQRAAANEALENFQAALDDARKLRSLDPKNVAANRIANNCQQALRG